MNASTVLSLSLSEAFDLLKRVVEGMTAEQYAWQPPGTGNAVSKLHAHTLTSADFWMNVMALGADPLWPAVAAETGLPKNAIKIWESELPIERSAMARYADDLCAAPVIAVSKLSEDELRREMDTPFFGRRDVAFVLRLAAQQLSLHTGEISAAKGMQGLQGLPF